MTDFTIMTNDELIAMAEQAETAYHDADEPIMTDAEYDQLIAIMNAKDIKRHKVGAKSTSGFNKMAHKRKRLSLDNAFSNDDMGAFIKRILVEGATTLLSEPKIDGLSLTLTYNKGILVSGVTRGDGFVGDDVTENVRVIKSIPHSICYKGNVDITGEVYMNKSDFLALNTELEAQGKKIKANPRNAASGALRQHDVEEVKNRNLSFFAYHVDSDGLTFDTDVKYMEFLVKNGFSVPEYRIVDLNDFEALLADYQHHNTVRSSRDYDVDGVVYKVNEIDARQRLGEGTRTPYWGIAWKFDAEIATTHVRDIIWQTGRTSVITPVAILEPVGIGGVIVSRATLHGMDMFESMNLSRRATVQIRRAGDVIPEILNVVTATDDMFEAVTVCSCCGSDIKRIGANIYCTAYNNGNPCRDRDIAALTYVVSRDVLNINFVGEGVIIELYDAGIIKNTIDLFSLHQHEGFRAVYPGRQGDKILASISDIADHPVALWRFISALMIPMIAKTTPKKIAGLVGNTGELRARFVSGYDFSELIGNVRNQNIHDWVARHMDYFDGLLACLNVEVVDVSVIESQWKGQSIVFTGSIEGYGRDEISALAEKYGIKVGSSVSKNTSLVVYGEKAGSKLEKATKLGVQTMPADEWLKTL